MRPRAPRVGDKYGRQVGDKCKIMRPRQPRVGDKWETSVKSCGPEHPEWNASRETKAKSCGPGTQPFERSKNPIQVNLFGEHHQIELIHQKTYHPFGVPQGNRLTLPASPEKCTSSLALAEIHVGSGDWDRLLNFGCFGPLGRCGFLAYLKISRYHHLGMSLHLSIYSIAVYSDVLSTSLHDLHLGISSKKIAVLLA